MAEEKMENTFEQRVKAIMKKIPRGKVACYGQVAAMAGNARGARQVVRVLHTSAEKEKLPWHRMINKQGTISLPKGSGYELQKAMLEKEGVVFDKNDRINLKRFLWGP